MPIRTHNGLGAAAKNARLKRLIVGRTAQYFASRSHAFVEGSATGLPVRELQKVDPPAETGGSGGSSFPSWDFFRSQKLKTPPAKVAMNQDVYTLPGGGGLVLQWPASMTTDDLEDVELWLEMMKRKLKRIVTKKEQNEAE